MPKTPPGRTLGNERAVADRLALERKRRDWTYDTVARKMEAAGCPIQISALHKLEKGNPPRRVTLDEAIALANVFEIPLDDLVTPVELLEQRRAAEIAVELEVVARELHDAARRVLRLFVECNRIAVESPASLEYVNSRMKTIYESKAANGESRRALWSRGEFADLAADDLMLIEQQVADVLDACMKAAHNAAPGAP